MFGLNYFKFLEGNGLLYEDQSFRIYGDSYTAVSPTSKLSFIPKILPVSLPLSPRKALGHLPREKAGPNASRSAGSAPLVPEHRSLEQQSSLPLTAPHP